jgi:type IV pilus assembly protein PilC
MIFLATIGTIIFLFGLALLISRFSNRLSLVDALMIMCGASICLILFVNLPKGNIPDEFILPLGLFFIALICWSLWKLAKIFIIIPSVDEVVRRGWIKIHPQILVKKKITKAILDHARAITKMNLPLADGFHLAGQQTAGRSGVVMQALAVFLQHGMTLSEAYSRYKARSSLVLSMMQIGERSGQLPSVLAYLQNYLDRQRREKMQWMPVWWPYPVFLLCFLLSVVTFHLIFMMPKYEQIFRDQGTTLPQITRHLISAGNFAGKNSLILLILALLIALAVWLHIQPRRYPKLNLYRRLTDRFLWHIPGWGKKYEYEGLAHAAAILRLCLGSRMPMPDAIQCVIDLDLNYVLRNKFEKLHDRVLRGQSVISAGESLHFPPRFLWALRPGQDEESLQTSLTLIERYYSLVASHWFLAISSFAWPMIIVSLGTMVGFIVLAYFLPLVKLINAATNY